MIKIDRFTENLLDDDFHICRKEVLKKLDELYKIYEDLTNDVSPKYWRSTGHHLTELRKMKEDIEKFEAISDKEMDNDWVRKNRHT
jgi:hypothetical protein